MCRGDPAEPRLSLSPLFLGLHGLVDCVRDILLFLLVDVRFLLLLVDMRVLLPPGVE